ncbi:fasciclin domain-containing protein [Falsiroseomonas bella]|nr:fasciclin domain-containing protein [Falsiroseomonas bella]
MTSLKRRGFLAFGSLAAGSLAAPAALRAQPQSARTLADTLAADTRFSRFLDLIVRLSAQSLFQQAAPMTVFAPVDQAFMGAPAGLLQDLVGTVGSGNTTNDSENQRGLALIRNHMVAGAFSPQQLAGNDRRLASVNGGDLQISGAPGSLTIRNPAPGTQIGAFGAAGMQAALPAQVLGSPVLASNGVIYPISQIIWP